MIIIGTLQMCKRYKLSEMVLPILQLLCRLHRSSYNKNYVRTHAKRRLTDTHDVLRFYGIQLTMKIICVLVFKVENICSKLVIID